MRWFHAAAVLMLCPCLAEAQQCVSGLHVQPGMPPPLPGRAAFQGYDAMGNTHLLVFNFKTYEQQLYPLKSLGVVNPLNPNFSPDGAWIVFTGTDSSTGALSVFILRLATSAVTNLTPADVFGDSNQDPKFSFNQKHLILKHKYNIVEYTIDLSNAEQPSISLYKTFTTNGVQGQPTEASAPSLSPQEAYVLFSRGSGVKERIHIIATDTGVETQFSSGGLYAYYPIVKDYSMNFYTGHTRKTGANDQIFMRAPGLFGQSATLLPLNDPNSDNSDAATVDASRIMFSNDGCRSDRIYRAYLGSIATGKVWDLYDIGLGANCDAAAAGVLGLDYTPTQ